MRFNTNTLDKIQELASLPAVIAGPPGVEPGKAVLETAVIPFHHRPKVDPRGLEPLTFPMPWGRATNYAMGPK